MPLIPDVIALTTIESQWGNRVRDQSVAVFTTTAERSAQLGIPTDGRMCYVADKDQLYVGRAGTWRPVAHDLCPDGMWIGSIQIAGSAVSGDEGGELRFKSAPNFAGHFWIVDAYRDLLRFFAQGKGNPLSLAFDTVHANAMVVLHQGIQMVGGTIALFQMPDNTDFRITSATMGNMLTVKSTGTADQGIRANINMQVPTLTTGNLVTITPGGQVGRSSRGINSLDDFDLRLNALESRLGAARAGSDVADRLSMLESRLDVLEARVASLEG